MGDAALHIPDILDYTGFINTSDTAAEPFLLDRNVINCQLRSDV